MAYCDDELLLLLLEGGLLPEDELLLLLLEGGLLPEDELLLDDEEDGVPAVGCCAGAACAGGPADGLFAFRILIARGAGAAGAAAAA